MLRQWANNKYRQTELMSCLSDGYFIWFFNDCVVTFVLSGVVQINKVELKSFQKILRKLASRKVGKSYSLKFFQSDSGRSLIKLIALPCGSFSGA